MSYIVSDMRPKFRLIEWRALVGYSLWTWVISVAGIVRDQPTNFIIGNFLGATTVGVVSVGSEVATLTVSEVVLPMGRSMFSAFALVKQWGEDMERIHRRLVGATVLFTLPINIGTALVAAPLVRLMLGPAWDAAIFPVQVIAVASALTIISHSCHEQFNSLGFLRQDFTAMVLGAIARNGLLLACTPWFGLRGAVLAIGVSMALDPIVYLCIKAKVLPYSVKALLGILIRPLLATGVMAGAVYGSGFAPMAAAEPTIFGLILYLGAAIAVGGLVYSVAMLAMWVLCGRPAGIEQDVLELVSKRLMRLRRLLSV
jgi:PST family polysaccharide transporter